MGRWGRGAQKGGHGRKGEDEEEGERRREGTKEKEARNGGMGEDRQVAKRFKGIPFHGLR